MTHRIHGTAALAAAATLSATLAVSCGGGSGPGNPTPPSTTPTTTLAPAGPGVGASCSLGFGSVAATCEKENLKGLANQVEDAINMLVRERPQTFDVNSVAVPNTDLYKVLDTEAYLDGIVTNLRRQGACAERDADDLFYQRILVKTSNEYSEVYDLIDSKGYVRRPNSGYLQTCTPAAFPVDRNSPDVPPAGSGCGRPYPPPLTRFRCKVHIKAPEYYTLDSSPQVGPDVTYCRAAGFTDGRSICDLRPEGAPDREACETWRTGKARDTGRIGPTWTNEDTGAYCTGEPSNCTNSPLSQYQLLVYRSGRFRVAAENGAYCIANVAR